MKVQFLAVMLAFVTLGASAEGYTATAKLMDGNTLLVLEHGKACGGAATAALLDKNGMDIDHTCKVERDASGVTAHFGGRAIFVPTGSFKVLTLPSPYPNRYSN
ncbi:hypothetical protein SAMN05446927_5387 [Caballeronia arationis]|uniref:Lipoprotein n=1 Tax=Caballeronia arationis TaxID=1777142 RepID=A0A7Z7IA10_9BURK|nr:hypothetical protein [Caballeronia arationis]SOE82079.1 hypothetical protein SAMN05446927_5387 [Caballeronia arationis]